MKKIIIFILIMSASINAKCTQHEALNKMMALADLEGELRLDVEAKRKKSRRVAKEKPYNQDKVDNYYLILNKATELINDFVTEYAFVSPKYLVKKKYTEACNEYSRIAKKYNFDLEEALKSTVKVKDLKYAAKPKRGNQCSYLQAYAVAMNLFNENSTSSTYKKMKNDKEFNNMIRSESIHIMKDPNRVCREIKKFTDKYNIPFEPLKNLKQKSKSSVGKRPTHITYELAGWFNPTENMCTQNGGRLTKGSNRTGRCNANWDDANRICNIAGGKLPSMNEFNKLVTGCSGRLEENNRVNYKYQVCYEKKGFLGGHYWSSEQHPGIDFKNHAWVMNLNFGKRFGRNKRSRSLVVCVGM